MKLIFTSILFFLICLNGNSQNIKFNLVNPQPVIQEVYSGSLLSGDLDGDGDIDIVQSGIGENLSGQIAEASVFINDGNGNFSLKEQNFNDFFNTEQIFMSDLDNDNDLDIIIAGVNRSELYRNDGAGNFEHDESVIFPKFNSGDLIIGDVDGDENNDVVIFAKLNSGDPFAMIFLNDGLGAFVEAFNTSFIPLETPRIEFIDLEGDGDRDIITTGVNSNDEKKVFIYENNGEGTFTVFSNSNIDVILSDEISVGDLDMDGDEDIFIAGLSEENKAKSAIYINDGSGQFTELMDTNLPNVFASSNGLEDLDNDGDLDLLIVGSLDGGLPNIFSIVFENKGNNNFVASDSLKGEYIPANTIADLNGDGKKDIIIQGFVDDTNIYFNESEISSTIEINEVPISIMPNPTNGKFQVKWSEGTFIRVQVLNLHGEVILEETIDKQELLNLDINGISGIYILRMYEKESVSVKKFLMQK